MPAERADAGAYTASSSAEGSKRPAAQDRAKGGAVKEQRQSIRQAILLSLDSSDKTSDQTRPEAKQPQRVGGREEMNAIDVGLTQTSRSEGTVESKEGCIGRRVEVFWEQEGRWFPGVIIGWRNTSTCGQVTGHMQRNASHAPRASRVAHHVAYDDGDDQWHHLEANSKDPDLFGFRWLDAHTPAPEGGSSRDPVKPPEPPLEAARTMQPLRLSDASTLEESAHSGGHSGERRKQARAADHRTSNISGKASSQMLDPSAPKKRRKGENLCEHQRRRSQCKDCGGSGLCEHQRVRSQCKDCREAKNKTAETTKQTEREEGKERGKGGGLE